MLAPTVFVIALLVLGIIWANHEKKQRERNKQESEYWRFRQERDDEQIRLLFREREAELLRLELRAESDLHSMTKSEVARLQELRQTLHKFWNGSELEKYPANNPFERRS